MTTFKIVYHLMPEADDIEITISAESYEEACVFAKQYRREGFSIEELPRLEIIEGDFVEGETVTVRVLDKTFTRKVKYSARKYADLYITINGWTFTYSEFYDPESYADIDYSRFLK